MSTALPKVFIVGESGTTGLRLHDRLSSRTDIELLSLPEEKRKDIPTIHEFAEEADLMFLCLPDAASKEIVEAVKDTDIRILDTSTAHRTADDWVYGFPELSETQKEAIASAKKVAVPGCHASGVISILYPLVHAGILPINYPLHCFSLTGYSGGGKKMIAQYEGDKGQDLYAPRQYGLVQQHKHLPEIVTICHLTQEPVFTPIVDDYYSGMEVMIPFFSHLLAKKVTAHDVWQVLASHYDGCPFVHVLPFGEDKGGFIAANDMSGYDDMEILVTGNDQRIMVTSLFDNLGKGASGAAIQSMNLMMGIDPTTGLKVKY